jgi:hypothetical protein
MTPWLFLLSAPEQAGTEPLPEILARAGHPVTVVVTDDFVVDAVVRAFTAPGVVGEAVNVGAIEANDASDTTGIGIELDEDKVAGYAEEFARKGSLAWLMVFGFFLGFSTVIAEPALIAVAAQAAIPHDLKSNSSAPKLLTPSMRRSIWRRRHSAPRSANRLKRPVVVS